MNLFAILIYTEADSFGSRVFNNFLKNIENTHNFLFVGNQKELRSLRLFLIIVKKGTKKPIKIEKIEKRLEKSFFTQVICRKKGRIGHYESIETQLVAREILTPQEMKEVDIMYLIMFLFVLFVVALDMLLGAKNKKSAPYVYDSQTMNVVRCQNR